MNREEFILTLRKELSKLPPEEIVAATEFFEECFADATEGLDDTEKLLKEQELIEEFGKPKRIAAQIKADYAARILDGDETILDKNPSTGKKLSAVWWVIIGICSAPVSIPIAIGIIWVAIGILSCIIGIYATIIGCGLGAIAAIVMGCIFLSSSAASGIMTIGGGLALLALSAAAAVGAFIGTRELVKWVARTIKSKNEKRRMNRYSRTRYTVGGEDGAWIRTDGGGANVIEAMKGGVEK